jgi:hypothetical protein
MSAFWYGIVADFLRNGRPGERGPEYNHEGGEQTDCGRHET